ncbi:hypothetical protein ACLKA6_007686 [Drosophila palustris]
MPKEEEFEEDEEQEDKSDLKADIVGRQHVPYILNGELYRIESQIGDNVTVKCCSCPPDRIYRGSVRSTGNFHMHIKRRHASLLGKLHEMKVAALVERRDRITKNRRIAKCRKKSTTPVPATVSAESPTSTLEMPKYAKTHELKIKTVFQRHKQEHHKQEEAAAIRTSVSLCESSLDNNSQSSGKLSLPPTQDNNNNDNNNNTNNIQNLQDTNNLSDMSPKSLGVHQPTASNDDMPALMSIPRLLPAHFIKPEQQNQVSGEQPEAIDLSRSSSLQSDDLEHSVVSHHSAQNVQMDVSSGQELATYVNGSPREILMRIDNTLGDIKDELQTRNQIERKRLLFDMAKFKFLHPNFNFDPPQ